MNFHKNRKSIRLKGYDYSSQGLYFITIVCNDRNCILGKIDNEIVIRSDIGEIAYNEWLKTSDLRPNIIIDSFIIMPNHIHGIIKIYHKSNLLLYQKPPISDSFKFTLPKSEQTLGSIIRGFKASVTKKARDIGFLEPLWQRGFYDHIIRDENSYLKIIEYINNNPKNWKEDRFFE
jgi:REP element-mobilizing transposase RayT